MCVLPTLQATFNLDYQMKKPSYAWAASFVDANTPWHDGASDFIDQVGLRMQIRLLPGAQGVPRG